MSGNLLLFLFDKCELSNQLIGCNWLIVPKIRVPFEQIMVDIVIRFPPDKPVGNQLSLIIVE